MPAKNSRAAVYIAECRDASGNLYAKVGMAANVLARVPNIQVGCPFEFTRIRFVYVATRKLAQKAERRCHYALRKLHLRGEWFYAAADDDLARVTMDCFSEVVAGVAGEPVKVGCLDMQMIDRTRKRYQSVFGARCQPA